MIQTDRINLRFLKRTPLYARLDLGDFRCVKEPGLTLSEAGINLKDLPSRLYIRPDHQQLALREIQGGFSRKISQFIKDKDVTQLKGAIVDFMEEALKDPKKSWLDGVEGIVTALITQFMDLPDVLSNMAVISNKDYSTAVHSTNVMALALSFGIHYGAPLETAKSLGLASLLHDVGKTGVPSKILRSPHKLNDQEFDKMKLHTNLGHMILKKYHFNSRVVAITALQHHEKNDGSGYPFGTTNLPKISRLVSIIDAYEALTSDSRPYRKAMTPTEALELIGDEVKKQKYDPELYQQFVVNLGPGANEAFSGVRF